MARVNRKDAAAKIARAAKSANTRTGIPALTGVLLECSAGVIRATASDLEVTCRTEIATEDRFETWRALVPAKLLVGALKASKLETIELGIVAISPEFRAGDVTLRTLPTEDFPRQSWHDYETRLPAGRYRDAVGVVGPACSRDDARPVLTGMLHRFANGTLTLVGTDSYRLHVAELLYPYGFASELIIPERATRAVASFVGRKVDAESAIGFGFDGSNVEWTFDDGTRYRSRIIEGEYPQWQQLVPDLDSTSTVGEREYHSLRIDAAAFADAIATAGAVVTHTTPIRLELNGRVQLSGSSPDLGRAVVEIAGAEWNGPDMSVAFNPGYLADAVRATGAHVLHVRDGLKPLLAEGTAGRALVMPVRLPAA